MNSRHRRNLVTALVALAIVLAGATTAQAGASIAELVDNQRATGAAFARVAPFAAGAALSNARAAGIREVISEGTLLSLDRRALAAIASGRPETMTLALPYGRSTVALELVRVNPFAPDFMAVTSEGVVLDDADLGVHYRGVVRGEAGSLASISFFGREVAGFAQSPNLGYLVLGRLEGDNARNEHVLYPTRALIPEHNWSCETGRVANAEPSIEEFLSLLDTHQSRIENAAADATASARCVRIYVEADYDLYQNKGSAAAVASWLSGLFAQSSTLYANDGVSITASEFYIWTRRSPYKGNSSSALLSSFQKNRKVFNGDLGHLVTFKNTGGVAAGFSGICNPTRSASQCYSGLDPTYNNVPTYSWSVMVFTHEMGHLMGSRHTHACVWNGNNTQIDGCSTPEGTCPQVGYPSGGGTIMSYCHLSGRPGTRFENGFGPQPGAVILNNVDGSVGSCLPSSCQ